MVRIVAVTGATGFIGRALLDRLTASGWEVRALTRRVLSIAGYSATKWVLGDLSDIRALRDLVSGAEAVIHCASAVRGRSWEDFLLANVTGTENLLRAASETNSCPEFLYISSLAAREPKLSWYARSKFEAEQEIMKFSGRLRCAVFRPAAVYGPGDRELKPLFHAMQRYGVLPAPGGPGNRFGLVYVDDLVAAIYCWLDTKRPATGVYEIDDGTPGGYSFTSIAAIAQRALNRPVRCFHIPIAVIRLLAYRNLQFSRFLNYAPMLTPGKVAELYHPDWTCNIAPLEKELNGWHPVINLYSVLPQLADA